MLMNSLSKMYENEGVVIEQITDYKYDIGNIEVLNSMLESESLFLQFKAIVGIRNYFSIEVSYSIKKKNLTIDIAVVHNIIPKLLNIVSSNILPSIVHEAAWALTNIANSRNVQSQCVCQNHAAQILTTLLSSSYDEIIESALWCLRNLIRKNEECCDLIIRHILIIYRIPGLIERICELGSSTQLSSRIRAQSVICLQNTLPTEQLSKMQMESIIEVLIQNILEQDDHLVQIDALCGLSECREEYQIQCMNDPKLINYLISGLSMRENKMMLPTLKIIGNFVAMDELEYTDIIINNGILIELTAILSTISKENIIRQILWIITNITAGPWRQVDKIFQLPELVNLACNFRYHKSAQIQQIVSQHIQQTLLIVSNLIESAETEHSIVFIETQMFKVLELFLISKKIEFQCNSLCAIKSLISHSQKSDGWISILEIFDYQSKWVSKVKALTTSPDQQVSQLAIEIIQLNPIVSEEPIHYITQDYGQCEDNNQQAPDI